MRSAEEKTGNVRECRRRNIRPCCKRKHGKLACTLSRCDRMYYVAPEPARSGFDATNSKETATSSGVPNAFHDKVLLLNAV